MGGVIYTGGGTSVPYVLGMQGNLLHTLRCCSITEAAGESGEEGATVVVWKASAAASAADGESETGSKLGVGSGGAEEAGEAAGVAATG